MFDYVIFFKELISYKFVIWSKHRVAKNAAVLLPLKISFQGRPKRISTESYVLKKNEIVLLRIQTQSLASEKN